VRRVDTVKRDTLNYTEFYWWKDEIKTEAQFKALVEKDQPAKEKKGCE